MDHLPATRTVQGLETVPYVCKKSYDGGPFLTYPIRENKPHVIPDPANGSDKMPFWEYEKRHPTPNEEFEAFCQTWLFFGLINELLGSICVSADFVRPDTVGDRKIISTSQLPGFIEVWIKSIKDGFSTTTYGHVAACLKQTFDTLRAARPEFDLRIKFCIASVSELFAYAANKAFGIENLVLDNKCPAAWRTLFENTPWLERWRKAGWCPSQIEILLRSSISLQPLYFFASLQDLVSSGRHRLCGIQKCVAYQTDVKEYKTQHLITECRCKELYVDSSRLIAVLSAGGLPVLRIRTGRELDDLSLDIIASQPDTHYVALSHVWADGLGNPKANSLPRCQLLQLSNLARRLKARLSLQIPQTELLLWCDTLCCPVNPQWARNRVLADMKNIYEQATCVLVLDASLKSYESEIMGPEEICARILTSGWMRRLWTLQEGALPAVKGRLWVQFCDQAINLHPITQQMNKLLKNDLSRAELVIAILSRIRTFTTFFDRDPNDLGADLGTVDEALQHRSVSVSSDEPLLVGTLLGLDVTKILNGSEETRIHRMWSLMPTAVRGLPTDILFRLGPRLSEEGYRWAPSSMLYYEDENPVIETMREGENQGIPTQYGLRVRLCGYSISFPQIPNWLPTCPWGLVLDQDCFYMRDHRGCWYFLRRRWPSALGDHLSQEKFSGIMRTYTNLWVLSLKNRPDDLPVTSTALVTRLSRECEDVKYVRSYMHIQVAELRKDSCEMFEAAYRCAQKLTESAPAKHLATMDQNGVHMESSEYKAGFDTLKPEMYRIAASSENGIAMATARETSGRDHDILFGAIVGMIFSGHHGIMGPNTPDDQQWCVD